MNIFVYLLKENEIDSLYDCNLDNEFINSVLCYLKNNKNNFISYEVVPEHKFWNGIIIFDGLIIKNENLIIQIPQPELFLESISYII